jgi:hypothetical protein
VTGEWKSTDDGLEWKDGGKVEFLSEEGTIVAGSFWIDAGFDGEDEYPFIGECSLADGSKVDFYSFKAWRPREKRS